MAKKESLNHQLPQAKREAKKRDWSTNGSRQLVDQSPLQTGSARLNLKADVIIRLRVPSYPSFDPQITSYSFKISENRQFPVFTKSAWAGLKFDRTIKLSRSDYSHKDLKIRSKNMTT